MDRDLFVSESAAAAFRISQVKDMRMHGATHIVTTKDGASYYISAADAKRLRDLQGTLSVFPHAWFEGEDCAFDTYYVTAMRTVEKGMEITFDASSGVPAPIILSEEEALKLMSILNLVKGA